MAYTRTLPPGLATRTPTWIPRRIRFTAEGAWFTLITLGVGFAALNTGNNLIYLVLGMMLTLIALSGILSELSVSTLSADRKVPDEIYAGREVGVVLSLYNLKDRLPALGIELQESGLINVARGRGYFVMVPAQTHRSHRVTYTFKHRGIHQLEGFVVGTSYPFGLFNRSYRLTLQQPVMVFPEIHPIDEKTALSRALGGEESLAKKGLGEEFYGLRDFVVGDDPRHVHWKTTARRGRLTLRENSQEGRRRVIIRFEPGPSPDLAKFEEAVSTAASYVHHYIGLGWVVGYEGPGEGIPPEEGRSHLRRILRSLALIAPEDRPAPVVSRASRGDRRVIVRCSGKHVVVVES